MDGDFRVWIELGNEAMSHPIQIAGALSKVAEKVGSGQTEGWIMDTNGNRCGKFEVDEDGSAD
jgi:hypothetical protein